MHVGQSDFSTTCGASKGFGTFHCTSEQRFSEFMTGYKHPEVGISGWKIRGTSTAPRSQSNMAAPIIKKSCALRQLSATRSVFCVIKKSTLVHTCCFCAFRHKISCRVLLHMLTATTGAAVSLFRLTDQMLSSCLQVCFLYFSPLNPS